MVEKIESSVEKIERLVRSNQSVILNSGFEVVSISPWQRAIELTVNDEAQILAGRTNGDLVRSQHLAFPKPLIILLSRYVPSYKPRVSEDCVVSKRTILIRDEFTCVYCDKYGDTIDHVVPQSKNGKNTWTNMVTACKKCNGKKADKSVEEVGFEMPVIPPLDYINFRFAHVEKAVREYCENELLNYEDSDANLYMYT